MEADADFFEGRGHHHLAVEGRCLDAGAETVVGVGVVVAPIDGEGAVAVEDVFGCGEEGFTDLEVLAGVATGLDAVGEGEAVEGVGLLLGLDHQVGVTDGGVGELAVPGEDRGGGEAIPLGLEGGGAGVVVVERELDRGVVRFVGGPDAWRGEMDEASEFALRIAAHAVDEFEPVLLIGGGIGGENETYPTRRHAGESEEWAEWDGAGT